MPRYPADLLSYLFFVFSLACSSQTFENGHQQHHSLIKLSQDAETDVEEVDEQQEPEEEESDEEDIVAIPPAIISGSYLVCETLSTDKNNRVTEVSCYFERDEQKVDISEVKSFDVKITDTDENELIFTYSVVDDFNIILNVHLKESNTISISVREAQTGEGDHTDPFSTLELLESSEPEENISEPEEVKESPPEEEANIMQDQMEQTSEAQDQGMDTLPPELDYVIVLMPGESMDKNTSNPDCSPNELFCFFLQNDRNLVVRHNPGGLRAGATGTDIQDVSTDYMLVMKPDQDLCLETIDRGLSAWDFCFGTQNQFSQDPKLVLTNLGELKLIEEDPSLGLSIIIPGRFDTY